MSVSPMAYYGGKTTLASRIAALLPPHEHYVEPFAGSLAVLLEKHPSKMETVNDIDGDLMTFWRILRDRPDDLTRVCGLTPHSRAELEAARVDTDDDLEQARRTWVRLTQGRTGSLRKTTGWRHYVNPAGGTPMSVYLKGYTERMAPAAARLKNVTLECRPANELIAIYGQFPDVCLYLDPPYLGSTRCRNYRREMDGDDEHIEMLDLIRGCRAGVVLSGYASDVYESKLADWSRIEISTATTQGPTKSLRTEIVWTNRDPGALTLFS